MKMIVGLGNPGTKYMATKHNIGFITLDEIAQREGCRFTKQQCEADIAEYFVAGEKVLLVKPLTFMNESGRSVGPLMDYYNLDVSDLLVIYDDLDLAVGRIRLREKGSAGGHNGIKSLIAHLDTKEFNRIKIGIDRPKPGQDVVSHVLGTFPKETHEEMGIAVKTAADATEMWLKGASFVEVMNQFNVKK